jgi:hypothetical protein
LQRDRVGQVFPVLDQLQQERLARRGLESRDDPEEKGERNQVGDENRVCKREHGERQRLHERKRLDQH